MLILTYPRSGHHLLINLLLRHYGSEVVTEGKKTRTQCRQVLKAGPFKYCEIYSHCGVVGCNEAVSLQKHHDFDFKLPYQKGVIVQYRKKEECLMSYYEYSQRKITRKEFLKKMTPHYEKWINKWVTKDNLCIDYHDLVTSTEDVLVKVLNYLDLPLRDMDFLKKIPIKNRRKA